MQHARSKLMPAFAFRHIKDLYPIFWNKALGMLDCIANETKAEKLNEKADSSIMFDAQLWAGRVTLDTIGSAGFAVDFGSLKDPGNPLADAYRITSTQGGMTFLMNFLSQTTLTRTMASLFSTSAKNMYSARATILKTCQDVLTEKRAKLAKGDHGDVDILAVALRSGSFDDQELIDYILNFLVAGHDTTAIAITWALYCLCKYPKVQTKLREEITAKLPSPRSNNADAPASVSAADIDDCAYLHAVCHETLRLHSPVQASMRTSPVDTIVAGHVIPANTSLILNPPLFNRSEALWGPDASVFKPERWLAPGQANKGGAQSNYAFSTFGHGPRACIAQGMAKAEMACLLAPLVGRYVMEMAEPEWKPVVNKGIGTRPVNTLWLRMRENEAW